MDVPERREYFMETKIDWLCQREEWAGLAAIGMVNTGLHKGDE